MGPKYRGKIGMMSNKNMKRLEKEIDTILTKIWRKSNEMTKTSKLLPFLLGPIIIFPLPSEIE